MRATVGAGKRAYHGERIALLFLPLKIGIVHKIEGRFRANRIVEILSFEFLSGSLLLLSLLVALVLRFGCS
jgi:hypothetical protein